MIQRYDIWSHCYGVTRKDDGEFVYYSDIEPLLREREEMMDVLKRCVDAIDDYYATLPAGVKLLADISRITGEVERW